MKTLVTLILLILVKLASADGPKFVPLTSAELNQIKNKPCVFVHLWATWCKPCVQELPHLLKILPEIKSLSPVIIDVSFTTERDSFSKKFISDQNPPFVTYYKSDEKEEVYIKAVDKFWTGTLPYSVLYKKGSRTNHWEGQLDLSTIKRELNALCS